MYFLVEDIGQRLPWMLPGSTGQSTLFVFKSRSALSPPNFLDVSRGLRVLARIVEMVDTWWKKWAYFQEEKKTHRSDCSTRNKATLDPGGENILAQRKQTHRDRLYSTEPTRPQPGEGSGVTGCAAEQQGPPAPRPVPIQILYRSGGQHHRKQTHSP